LFHVKHRHVVVANFIGSPAMNLLPIVRDGDVLTVGDSDHRLPLGRLPQPFGGRREHPSRLDRNRAGPAD
jgi:hypothetical protein